MKINFYVSFRQIITLVVGLTIGLTIKATLAWVEPDQMPPGGNIAAPLNTSETGQIKAGGLILNAGGATLGLIVERGLDGIGTDNPQATLDVNGTIRATGLTVETTSSGFLPPRMTTAQRNAIGSPQFGMMIANTDTKKMNMYNGSAWEVVGGDSTPTGTIAYFDLTVCPAGWSEATNAKGRYIVGTQNSANKNLAVGQALGDGENRSTGLHSHGVWDPGHAHGVYDPGHAHGFPGLGCNGYTPWNCNSIVMDANGLNSLPNSLDRRATGIGIYGSGTGIGIYNAGSVGGTNAPYVEFLTCRKN